MDRLTLIKLAAFHDELERIEKEARVLEALGKLTQRGARRTGKALKKGYEKAQLTAGDIMTGSHGRGFEHAMQKMPTASPLKMGLAYATDPHVQRAAAGHVAKAGRVVGRGAQSVGRGIREAVTPKPRLRPAMAA